MRFADERLERVPSRQVSRTDTDGRGVFNAAAHPPSRVSSRVAMRLASDRASRR
jgi:hypothetical protein